MARWTLRIEPYKISPPDADKDMIIQEDTAWERPGGLQLVDRFGNLIQAGMRSDVAVDGLRYVDADGKEHAYTPRWAGKIDVEEDELGGLETLKDRGLRTVGDMSKPLTDRTIAAQKKKRRERVQEGREKRIEALEIAEDGTFGKPIFAKDLDEALDLIEAGHFVELANDNEVHTLVEELAEMVMEASKLGIDAPDYNLCYVSVKGSNIFCADQFKHSKLDNLREDMPQLGGEAVLGMPAYETIRADVEAALARSVRVEMEDGREVHYDAAGKKIKIPTSAKAGEAWKAHLLADGVETHDKDVQSSRLKASQKELVGEKVAGMTAAGLFKRRATEAAEANAKDPSSPLLIDNREYLTFDDARKGKENPDFGKEVTLEMADKLWTPLKGKIFVSSDGYVIDGHHRWAAILGMDAADGVLDNEGDLIMTVEVVGLTIHEALADATKFTTAFGIKPKKAVAADMGGGGDAPPPPNRVGGGPRREVIDTRSMGRASPTDITDVVEADLDYSEDTGRTQLVTELRSLWVETNDRIVELTPAGADEFSWDTDFRDDPDLSDEVKAELEELFEDKKKYSDLQKQVERTITVGDTTDPFEDSSRAEFDGSEATAHVTETMAAVADVEEIIRERRRENHLANARAMREVTATQEARRIEGQPGYQVRVSEARPEPVLGTSQPKGTTSLTPREIRLQETPDPDNPRGLELLVDRADQTRVTATDITSLTPPFSRALEDGSTDAAIAVLTGIPTTQMGRDGEELTSGIAGLEERLADPMALENADAGYRLVNSLYEQRGFDGQPLLVTADELDEMLLSGGFLEVVRGGEADVQDQHLNGELLLGNGVDGAGFYFAIELGDSGAFPAARYASGAAETEDGRPGTVIRGGLNPTAKTVSLKEIDRITDEYQVTDDMIGEPQIGIMSEVKDNPLMGLRVELSKTALLTEDHPMYDEERAAQARAAIRSLDLIMTRSMDGESDHVTTAAAMLLGYDAIMSDETRAARGADLADNRLIVLNRSAVVMADTVLDVKESGSDTYEAVDADGNPVVGSTHLAGRMNPKLDERGAPRYDPNPVGFMDYSETTTFVEGYVASALEQFDEVNAGVLDAEVDAPDSRQVLADEIRGHMEVLEGELQIIRNRINDPATDPDGRYELEDAAIAKQAEIDVSQGNLDDVFAGRDAGPSESDLVAEKLARVRRKKLHGTEETAAIPFDLEEHEAMFAGDVELVPLPDSLAVSGIDDFTDDELKLLDRQLLAIAEGFNRPIDRDAQSDPLTKLRYVDEDGEDVALISEDAPAVLEIVRNRLLARGIFEQTAEEAAGKRGTDNLYILSVEKLTGVRMSDAERDKIYNGRVLPEIPTGLTTGEIKERGAISVAAEMGGEDLDQLHDIIMGLRSGGLDKEIFGPRVAAVLGAPGEIDRRALATAVIEQVHDRWAVSSGNQHPTSLATQVAAARAAGMDQDEMLSRAFYFIESERDRRAVQQIADSIVARIRRGDIDASVLNDENGLKALARLHGTMTDDIIELLTGERVMSDVEISQTLTGFDVENVPTGMLGTTAGNKLTAMSVHPVERDPINAIGATPGLEAIANLDPDAVAFAEGKPLIELLDEVDSTGKRPEVTARMKEIRQELGVAPFDPIIPDEWFERRHLAEEYLELAKRETPQIGSDEQEAWDVLLALKGDDILPKSSADSRLGGATRGEAVLVEPSPRWAESGFVSADEVGGLPSSAEGYFDFDEVTDVGLLRDRDKLRELVSQGKNESVFSQRLPAELELLGIEEELKRRGVVEIPAEDRIKALKELLASAQAVADLEFDRRAQGGLVPSTGFGRLDGNIQTAVGALIVDDFFGEYNQSVLSADTAAAQLFLKEIASADGTITLYRGIGSGGQFRGMGDIRGTTVMNENASPRSSWAFDPSIAKNFAGGGIDGFVIEAKIPIEDIAGLSILGSGCLGEAEVLVVGSDRAVKIFSQNRPDENV